MAIVRAVNGLVEVNQKGQYAKSVAFLAQQIGLPRMLVDLRHSATHDVLPPLSSLRLAASLALEWLDTNYWQAQENVLVETTTRIQDLLKQYAELQESSSDPAPNRPAVGECVKSVLGLANSNMAREILVPSLMTQGHLLPAHMYQVDEALYNEQKKKRPRVKERQQFSQHAKRWDQLLLACSSEWDHFLGTLLASIIESVVQLSESPKHTAKAKAKMRVWLQWMEHLLYERRYQELRDDRDIQLPVIALIQSASRHISPWTNRIIRLLLPWISNPALADKMRQLVRVSSTQRAKHVAKSDSDQSLEVFESLIGLIQERGVMPIAQPSADPTTGEGPWKRCEGWTPCSLGMSIMNEMPNLLLPPEFDVNGAITLVPEERPIVPFISLPLSSAALQRREMTQPADEGEDEEEEDNSTMATRRTAIDLPPSVMMNQTIQTGEVEEVAEAQQPPPTSAVMTAALLFSPLELTRL